MILRKNQVFLVRKSALLCLGSVSSIAQRTFFSWDWCLVVVCWFVCSKLRYFKHAEITVVHHVVTVSLAKVRFPLVQCWLVHQRHIGHRAHHNAFIVNGHGLCVHPGRWLNQVSGLTHNPDFNLCSIGHANQLKSLSSHQHLR